MKIFIIFSIFVAISLLSLSNADYSKAQSFAEKRTEIETLSTSDQFGYHSFGGKYNNVYLMVYDTADASSRLDSLFLYAYDPKFRSWGLLSLTNLYTNVLFFATSSNARVQGYKVNFTQAIDSLRVWFYNQAPTGRKTYYYFRLVNTY